MSILRTQNIPEGGEKLSKGPGWEQSLAYPRAGQMVSAVAFH